VELNSKKFHTVTHQKECVESHIHSVLGRLLWKSNCLLLEVTHYKCGLDYFISVKQFPFNLVSNFELHILPQLYN